MQAEVVSSAWSQVTDSIQKDGARVSLQCTQFGKVKKASTIEHVREVNTKINASSSSRQRSQVTHNITKDGDSIHYQLITVHGNSAKASSKRLRYIERSP